MVYIKADDIQKDIANKIETSVLKDIGKYFKL